MFGIATEAEVRLLPLPEAVKTCLAPFPSMVAACEAVSDIVAHGIVPAALEMLDRATIEVVEAGVSAAGYPKDAEAVLLVEFDGAKAAMGRLEKEVEAICRQRGAVAFTAARDAEERERLWKGRKVSFGAMGRCLHRSLCAGRGRSSDTPAGSPGPRSTRFAREYRIRVANVFSCRRRQSPPLYSLRRPRRGRKAKGARGRASDHGASVCR